MQQRGVFAIEPALEARRHLEDHLHVRGPEYRVGDDLVVVEVNHGRKVELRTLNSVIESAPDPLPPQLFRIAQPIHLGISGHPRPFRDIAR